MNLNDPDIAAAIDRDRSSMLRIFERTEAENLERLSSEDVIDQLMKNLRDAETIADAAALHPAVVRDDTRYRYAWLSRMAIRSLISSLIELQPGYAFSSDGVQAALGRAKEVF